METPTAKTSEKISESCKTMSELELLTVSEAASLLRVSESTLYRLRADKSIPHFRVGHQIFFQKSDLINFFWQT